MKTATFDAAKFLKSEEAITAYINAAIEEGDNDLLMVALGNVIRAKGIAKVSKNEE